MTSDTRDSLPVTEQENPRTKDLSSATTAQIVSLMNEEDALVAPAVSRVLGEVAKAVEGIVKRLETG